ncbi:hypothetical protein CEXT_297091 [Caerostris extrusa]|uniref:Uncharacterized protein n=1 Tax=Caerostris extrusa TaxID=172846 RepID=A0AAV4MEF2_CAEEX|nr:hypothetical protein CEXT_297091 [Caerostris extrusa]
MSQRHLAIVRDLTWSDNLTVEWKSENFCLKLYHPRTIWTCCETAIIPNLSMRFDPSLEQDRGNGVKSVHDKIAHRMHLMDYIVSINGPFRVQEGSHPSQIASRSLCNARTRGKQ